MRLIKHVNNNAAIARDSAGNELVVLGKGIGFPKMPYELEDLSKIERTFYDTDPRYLDMIAALPKEILLASSDIVEQAEINLDCELNTNLPFTLADHISFAIERMNKGIEIIAPIAYDVAHLYPLEFELGQLALDIVQDYTDRRLPNTEAVSIAMHLITAQMQSGDMHNLMQSMEIITAVKKIIEGNLNFTIDETSYHYARFTMHLRYLIKRLSTETEIVPKNSPMLKSMAREYTLEYQCLLEIAGYFEKVWNWKCDEEEKLYLLIHLTRLSQKNQ